MEYQVSARKWRPQKFSELIGQEHIVRTLKNAIELDRIAHAYLFSGTRGVGKTTTARLLAKALNCEKGPTPEPCDTCTHCIEIREGNSLDVLEIDGASNNGVAEVRDLIENVQYSTSSCRFKVYIIDEVHMLSRSAFNALLKTLEEPPPQVVFLFATTELIKIPETILSRCQCFEFKPLNHAQICAQLELICEKDNIAIDQKSLEEIATNGAGSMRDAQSLLDQVIAFAGRAVDHASVESVLGIVGQGILEQFMDRVIAGDSAALLGLVQEVADHGKDLSLFCRDLIEYVRNLMFVKVSAKPETLVSTRTCDIETLKTQAGHLDTDQLQQMFTVLSRAEMDMKRGSLPRLIFEMAVLRLTDVRPYQEIDQLIQKINAAGGGAPSPASARAAGAAVVTAPQPAAAPSPSAGPAPSQEPPPSEEPPPYATPPVAYSEPAESQWDQIRALASEKKRSLATFLDNCTMVGLTGDSLHLRFPDPYTKGLVEKEENLEVVRVAAQAVCGRAEIQIKLDVANGTDDNGADSNGSSVGEAPAQNANPAPAAQKKTAKRYDKKGSPSEEEILKDALDIFGGIVIR
ncbi:DNA polymerase III subunit gamma/tau [Nitrospina gracilis]|uniref:DNA polymerase III subunit gamma/tau n=1 Tax=Nitrospina gracilis TaxID=35801 RepID=UPI001F019C6B|nr:DNA polymerase III subunit gamma/tau [Nitrospina gracilis]MCF8719141.1 DNA polymerase-3 subunit gamma/tau [Nitrospina gracilis Nb-211]